MAIYETETSGKATQAGSPYRVLPNDPGAGPPDPPFLVAVNDRLDRLGKLLDECRSMAAVLRERTMGPWPDEPCGMADPHNGSEFGVILNRLDNQIIEVRLLCEHVGALASRI